MLAPPIHSDAASVGWEAAVVAGQLAVASELVAGSREMLRLARGHAVEREQFGVPIASFQAVRHRLAEALVAVEAAAGAVAASWEEPTPYTAAMAKSIAGRSARTVARHAQQVLAGMGFTSDHAFHRYFRRSLVLDHLFGSSASLSERIGAEVLRTGVLPPVRPL
jgi:alkylation response protein AidB-like acyl-CoA dehydrogenase